MNKTPRLSVAPRGTADAIFELQTLKGFKSICTLMSSHPLQKIQA